MPLRRLSKRPLVFVSYSHHDEEVVVAMAEKLRTMTGGSVDFFVSRDATSSSSAETWPVRLEETLRQAWCVLAIVSHASATSEWVLFEAGFAKALGIPVIPIGINGFEVARHKPPLSLLQAIDVIDVTSLNRIVIRMTEFLQKEFADSFTEDDYMALFGGPHLRIPAITTFPLVNRREIYKEVSRLVNECDLNAEIRATAMIFDPDDLKDKYFVNYLETVARKCGEAESTTANMIYHVVIAVRRPPGDPLPRKLWRALKTRVEMFHASEATRRMRLFTINEHWSLNMLLVNRDHAIIAFPGEVKDSKLKFGVRISGADFVSPMVDWYDRCVERRAHRLSPQIFLAVDAKGRHGGLHKNVKEGSRRPNSR